MAGPPDCEALDQAVIAGAEGHQAILPGRIPQRGKRPNRY
jgi:hypothetical protein